MRIRLNKITIFGIGTVSLVVIILSITITTQYLDDKIESDRIHDMYDIDFPDVCTDEMIVMLSRVSNMESDAKDFGLSLTMNGSDTNIVYNEFGRDNFDECLTALDAVIIEKNNDSTTFTKIPLGGLLALGAFTYYLSTIME